MKAPLAQLVEHLTLNQGVQGSSPWRRTRGRKLNLKVGFRLFVKYKILQIINNIGLRRRYYD